MASRDGMDPQANHQHHQWIADVTDVVCEFLEVATHQVLFVRAIYPKRLHVCMRAVSRCVVMMEDLRVCRFIFIVWFHFLF